MGQVPRNRNQNGKEKRFMKLTNSESSLIDAMLDVVRKALRSYLPTQRKSSTRSTSVQTALTDRGSTIRAAIRSGKSKSSVRRQFRLTDYEYRGHRAVVTRQSNGN